MIHMLLDITPSLRILDMKFLSNEQIVIEL